MLSFNGISNAISLYQFRSDRSEFYYDLAEMFESGQSLRKFIEIQAEITKNTKQKSFHAAYGKILRRFDSGEGDTTLPALLDGIVPEQDLAALFAIEESGALRKHIGLRELANSIMRERQLTMLILKALAMPVVLIPFIGYMSYILADVILVVEKSSPIFMRGEIFSGFNELVRVLAVYTREFGALIVSFMIAFTVGFAFMLPNFTGSLRLKIDHLPGFGLYRDFQSAKVFSSLAMLLESGKKLIPALEMIADRGSKWSRWQVGRILNHLEDNPTDYAGSFALGLCSAYVEGRIDILTNILQEREARGDYSLSFSDVIITVGKKEVEKTLKRIQVSSLALNTLLLTGLFSYASVLGLGSMTIPGKFSDLMEPSTMTIMKAKYDAEQRRLKQLGLQ